MKERCASSSIASLGKRRLENRAEHFIDVDLQNLSFRSGGMNLTIEMTLMTLV